MLLYNSLFAALALVASTTRASYVTVASTTTKYVSTTTKSPIFTPTPTPSFSFSTSTCTGWACPSTSCLPSTTKIIYSVCNDKCLAKSTTTSTFTTYPPPITATVPCGPKYPKRGVLYADDGPELEKRWTCAPGPTSTSVTTLPCSACIVYPHSTVVTTSVVSTNTVFASCPPSSSTPPPKSTSTPAPTSVPTWSMYCFWLCTNSTTRTTIYNSATVNSAGWDRCVQACT